MSRITKRGPVTPTMNMTPLIDVTFLLIVFFMLVSNIVSEENLELIPPRLDEPQTKSLGEVERVVVSVGPQRYNKDERTLNPLAFDPLARVVQVGIQTFDDPGDLVGITDALKEAVARSKAKSGSDEAPVEVLLRADAALYYREVQPIMTAITGAGVGTVHLVAYMPDE